MSNKSRNQLLEEISNATFDIRNNATIAGYGSIGVNTPVAIGAINATPQVLTGFDTILITTPRGVTQDLATGSLSLGVKGVWTLFIKASLTFDELNSGRQISLQLYNLDTATPAGTIFNYFVGRNTAGVNLNVSLPFEVDPSIVGDKYQLRIFSQADVFANSSNIGTTYSFTNNSPVTELF